MYFDISNLIMHISDQSEKDWIDYLATFSSAIIGICTVIAAIIANCISKNNLKQQTKQFSIQLKEERKNLLKQLALQKKQWLNDSYIRNEADVILAFRNMVYESESAFFWFSSLLMPYKTMEKMFPEQDVKLKGNGLIVDFNDYCKNYDILNKLNNYYNHHQMILKKNGIEEEFIYITAILSTICWFDNTDNFYYSLVSEDSSCIKYKLNVIEKIGKLFVQSIEFEKGQTVLLQYDEEKLQAYANNIINIYFQLRQKLDELTTFYDGELPANLLSIEIKSFADSSFIIKELKKTPQSDTDIKS